MESQLRIGELARRTGVSTHVLRVWENRYLLLTPVRSENGYRRYSLEDERRVREMLRLQAQGVTAAEAAARVLAGTRGQAGPDDLETLLSDLLAAFTSYDEPTTHAVIDAALVAHPLEEVIERLFFSALRRLGDAWAAGEASIAQEHYASSLIRGRMLALGPEVSRAVGGGGHPAPVAVLACTAHEHHDIALLALDLMLRRQGWQVTFLGADTPVSSIVDLAADLDAALVVLAGTEPRTYAAELGQHAALLAGLPEATTLALAGVAATPELAQAHGATVLPFDPVVAAAELTELAGAGR